MNRIYIFILAVMCFSSAAFSQSNILITSFNRNGLLSWSNTASQGVYTVQWSPNLTTTNGWQSTWDTLSYYMATGETCRAFVPMFYRIIWQDLPKYESFINAIGVGDGMTASFSGVLSNVPCRKTSISVTAGTKTLTDSSGDGTLSGDGTGTINYTTGNIVASFDYAPAVGRNIICSYQALVNQPIGQPIATAEAIATGNGSTSIITNTLSNTPIQIDSLTITDSNESFTDVAASPSDGSIYYKKIIMWGDKGGVAFLDYFSGEIEVTFSKAPTNGQSVMVYYTYLKN